VRAMSADDSLRTEAAVAWNEADWNACGDSV
jgi:hypothetical protein